MDYLSRHLAGLPRRLNVAPQLDSIGFIPEKRDIVDRIFPSWNFSFVLAGEGFYELGGVRHKVRAPAVLTQWPGEPMHYGPDSAWREIFLIYPENCGEKLRELGLMRENRPFWQVGNPHRLFELAEEFETLAADAELESNTDRLDCCAAVLRFASGALVNLAMSFDVWKHSLPCIELHGTAGSLSVPDPNCFGGEVRLFLPHLAEWAKLKLTHGYTDNMRGIGAADLARSLSGGVPARACGELAFHVLDVMCGISDSARTGAFVKVQSTCERPAPLPVGLRHGQLELEA